MTFSPSNLPSEHCMLCPRLCGADRARGDRGLCGAGSELVVARAAAHAWEEPPISGVSGSGTVFFSHCPLGCIYCQNHEIAVGDAGKAISANALSEIFLALQRQGLLNINLVTPTHYLPQIMYAIDRARALGLRLPIIYNTSGYELPEAVSSLATFVDVYLTDFKYWSQQPARAYSKAPDYPDRAREALESMVQQTGPPVYRTDSTEGTLLVRGTVVRHMLLPGMLEDSKRIVSYLHERYGTDIVFSLMNQYTPLRGFPGHPELESRVSADDYEELLDFVDALGVEDYFWQEGDAVGESFIPAFDGTGVEV